MQRMFEDGQLTAEKGRYSPSPPVPAIPQSPEQISTGTKEHEGQGYRENNATDHPPNDPEDPGPSGALVDAVLPNLPREEAAR